MNPAGPVVFDGRVVIVTGAAGGLGTQHCRLFAARGAAVVVNDVRGAVALADDLIRSGARAVACDADVTTEEGAGAIAHAALESFGSIDVLVNNAGILRSCDIGEHTAALWDEVMSVNLRGAYLMTRAVWPTMAARGYGRIVSTTSNSGLLGTPGSVAYAAAKAGLWGLTRTLALEGAPLGINVNAVAPIAFTPMSATSRNAPPSWRSGEGDAWAATLKPSLVSPVVAWLAHHDCVLNGEVLSAAAGRVARFFLGLTHGVLDGELTIETVRDRLGEIVDESGYDVLPRAFDEGRNLHRRIAASPR